MASGVASIKTLIIAFITGIEKLNAITVNIIEINGSIIIHEGLKYNIVAAITTPADYTISPRM